MQLSQNFTTSIALFYIYSRCVMISTAASLLSTAASFRRSSTWWGWHRPLPPTSGKCPQTWTWWQWWHCLTAWPPGTRPSVRCKGIGRVSGTRGCLRQLAWSCGCPRALPSSSWGHSSQKNCYIRTVPRTVTQSLTESVSMHKFSNDKVSSHA